MKASERLGLVLTGSAAWFAFLLLWVTAASVHLLLLFTLALVLVAIGAIYCMRLVTFIRELVARIRSSPSQLGNVVARILDSDAARSGLGVLSLGLATVGVAGAIASLRGNRPGGAVVGWGAAGVVGIVASWYLIAWRRRIEPVARVEALTSSAQLHFTAEDQEDPSRLDLTQIHKLVLAVEPVAGTDHWRLGIEFSDNQRFSGWRYGIGHALWHLTKNAGDPRLLVSYYNAHGQYEGNSLALSEYSNEPVHVTLEPRDGALAARVLGHPGYTRLIHADNHRFGRLFAWADGRKYELTVSVRVE